VCNFGLLRCLFHTHFFRAHGSLLGIPHSFNTTC
jgi:hypothetical protein